MRVRQSAPLSGYTRAKPTGFVSVMNSAQARVRALPPIAGDTALTVVTAVYASLHLLVTQSFGPGRPESVSGVAYLLAVLCAGSLLVRSRWPLASLFTIGGFGALYLWTTHNLFPILPAVLIVLYSAVAYSERPHRVVWATAIGVAVLLNATNQLARPFRFPESLTGLLLDSGWMLIALLLGEALRNRHSLAQAADLRALNAERMQQEMAQRQVAEERLRIARDLHDILAHSVALINIQAGVAAHVLDQQPEQAREALVNIKEASRATLHELRAMVGVLRDDDSPAPLAPTPGLAALDDLLGAVREAGLTVEADVRRPPHGLPALVDAAAYRIVQEALTNVIKHAPRATVRVAIGQDADTLNLDIVNQAGQPPVAARTSGSGHGIIGMRERALALGGSLQAGPLTAGGFRVQASLPLAEGATR